MMMIPWHKIELNENSKIKNNKVFQFHKPAKRAKCNFFYVSWMQFFDKSTMPHGISERIFNCYDAFTLAHPCDLLLISKDGPYLVIYFQCIVPFLKSETKTLNDLVEYYQCIAKIWICTAFWCISRSSLLIFFHCNFKIIDWLGGWKTSEVWSIWYDWWLDVQIQCIILFAILMKKIQRNRVHKHRLSL